MKQVSVLVTLMFDMRENGNAETERDYVVKLINETLSGCEFESQPQINSNASMVITAIEPSFTEDVDTDDETTVWSQISNDFEDEGMVHIDAWTSEDDNENGKVIAKVSIETGEVTYLDERAKTDWKAQEAINEAITYSTKKGL
jgi:hypothetical protein